jgi:hypothetical protein
VKKKGDRNYEDIEVRTADKNGKQVRLLKLSNG